MAEPGTRRVAAVVLAGGGSRRFGSDKLVADLGGRSLLDHALDGLPEDAGVAVIGPERPVSRAVAFLREDPPGGGPAAGLITGLRWALASGAEVILTLPGDAPAGGRAAAVLAEALDRTRTAAVVGLDATGREQVLQLALRPPAARALIAAAGAEAGQGESVRRLMAVLSPPAHRELLPDELTYDIDTTDQLRHFRNQKRA